MLVHKCDRCGVVYEKPNPLLEGYLKYEIKKGIGFTVSDVDLCPFCEEGLYKFLMEEEHFRAEDEKREKRIEAGIDEGSLLSKLLGRK